MKRRRVLIGCDFDGTLAPLVSHPDLAVPDPRAPVLMERLAAMPGVRVVVVSGRALGDLRSRLGDIRGVILVGEHGNDVGEDVEPSEELDEARVFVEWLHAHHPAATVESKPRSVTFHTRSLDDEQSNAVSLEVADWAAGHPGIGLLQGKEVFELTVATRNKGDCISELAADVDGTVFVGDDVTDETVFERLGPRDIGIKVGPGHTSAGFRVADIEGVMDVFELMASTLPPWREPNDE